MGINKYNSGDKNDFNSNYKVDNILIGKVIDVNDIADGNRIKVRIKGIDDKKSDTDIPYCFPLLPKFLNIVPSKGESVFIFLIREDNKTDNRMWIGPIISQPQKLKYDPHYYSSRSLLTSGLVNPEKSPSKLPEANGVYPNKSDIAIQGRDNSDIIFKPNEIQIRSGKFEINNNLKFNKKNIGYIQIKSNVDIDTNKKGSVTNIVSNKINLLSHDGVPRFNLDDQNDLITDDELNNIIKNTHPLAYGDVVFQFLKLVKNYAVNHVHPYHGKPPVQDVNVQDLNKFNINSILSNNIRIN